MLDKDQAFWVAVIEAVVWPLAFLIAAGIAGLAFHARIAALIDRMKTFKWGAMGVEAAQDQRLPPQQALPESQVGHLGEISNFARSYKSVPAMAAGIKGLLESTNPQQVENNFTQELILVLAMVATQRNFERTFSVIHGSQLQLLRRLLESPSGLSKAELSEHVSNLRTIYKDPYENVSDADYVRWLVTNHLVHFTDETMHITPTGEDFMRWIAENRRRTDRPL